MVCLADYQDYLKALQLDRRMSGMAVLKCLTRILIEELAPRETDTALDVGTGTGRLGMTLRNLIPRGMVVGIDSSDGMLTVARDKTLKYEVDNFRLVRGRAEILPFASGTFDSACLVLSFHHFTDPQSSIAELYRALKPGGHIVSLDPVLTEPEDGEEQRLNESIEEAFQEAHGPDFRFFTSSELRRLYRTAGFSINTCRTRDFAFDQAGIEGIPMGAHWFQAYQSLRFRQQNDLVRKFEHHYFAFRQSDDQLLVRGKVSWVIMKVSKSH